MKYETDRNSDCSFINKLKLVCVKTFWFRPKFWRYLFLVVLWGFYYSIFFWFWWFNKFFSAFYCWSFSFWLSLSSLFILSIILLQILTSYQLHFSILNFLVVLFSYFCLQLNFTLIHFSDRSISSISFFFYLKCFFLKFNNVCFLSFEDNSSILDFFDFVVSLFLNFYSNNYTLHLYMIFLIFFVYFISFYLYFLNKFNVNYCFFNVILFLRSVFPQISLVFWYFWDLTPIGVRQENSSWLEFSSIFLCYI